VRQEIGHRSHQANRQRTVERIAKLAKRQRRAPQGTLLAIDATTGQNALTQAKQFKDAVAVTGVILVKLDATAKGSIVFAIAHELGLPVRFVGGLFE
jgi:fused signal recognition particle receptor